MQFGLEWFFKEDFPEKAVLVHSKEWIRTRLELTFFMKTKLSQLLLARFLIDRCNTFQQFKNILVNCKWIILLFKFTYSQYSVIFVTIWSLCTWFSATVNTTWWVVLKLGSTICIFNMSDRMDKFTCLHDLWLTTAKYLITQCNLSAHLKNWFIDTLQSLRYRYLSPV